MASGKTASVPEIFHKISNKTIFTQTGKNDIYVLTVSCLSLFTVLTELISLVTVSVFAGVTAVDPEVHSFSGFAVLVVNCLTRSQLKLCQSFQYPECLTAR